FFTRENVLKRLKGPTLPVAIQIVSSKSLEDIFAVINAIPTQEQWFLKWRSLFTRQKGVTEADVSEINSSDSITGWTAANVARRPNATTEAALQLREIYRSHEAATRGQSPTASPRHL